MKPPPDPRLVALVALLLPGVGQVMNRQPWRGLTFVLFAILLGSITMKTAAPEASFVGRISGGLFVWAMAAFDAYRTARLRRAFWEAGIARRGREGAPPPQP